MSTINTSLKDILQSELVNMGLNEFDFKDNQLQFFNDEYIFIKKIINYDDDVHNIVNNKIFYNLDLDDPEHDRKFKRHFINKFLENRPCYQTLEIFASKVINVFLNNIDFLNEYYTNIDNYIKGKNETGSTGNRQNISDNRMATATLPQNEINLNVDNTILDYADDNTISRNKETTIQDDSSDSFSYDLETLKESQNLLESVFNQFEKECFLKTW